jgi:uncharacterized membrane protein
MASLQEKIDELSRRISELSAQQMHMGKQLLALMNELDLLKQQANASTPVTPTVPLVPEKVVEYKETISAPGYRPVKPDPVAAVKQAAAHAPKRTASFEEFIGKNLASKIGILVTIVGIFIGARYAIEHNMVSPVVRIVSGYAWGIAFVGVALWLKKKYIGYSAVLMGGGLCVLYFITYVGWSTYGLLPQMAAFGLMLLFTVVIVYMAVWYNQIIIAHLGQVGAYAIPFLLSNDSGRYELLFTYIAIINAGILVLSFYKYWKSLYHVAFALTWLIFGAWYLFQYEDRHFTIAASFLAVFFIMFYATFLAYKLIRKEQYAIVDIYLLLSNAFVFYAIGYDVLERHAPLSSWQGAFTVVNALIHFAVSVVIRKLKLADRSLYYLVLGLVVVFLAIAVPVQFDGNWVTLLWTAEAVLLFAIGRTRRVPAYEKLAAPLTFLGFASLVQDWLAYNNRNDHSYFLLNITFITGLLVAGALSVIAWLNHNKQWRVIEKEKTGYQLFFDYILPVLLLCACYFVFFVDIAVYFRDLGDTSLLKIKNGLYETKVTGGSFLFLYSEVFVMVLLLLYKRWIKSPWLGYTGIMGTVFLAVSLIIEILPLSNEMMAADHAGTNTGYFGAWHTVVRYVSLGMMALLFAMGSKEVREYAHEPTVKKVWWLLVYGILLGAISFEYLNWTTIVGKGNQYAIGLSVIWGLFALVLVGYGIWKKVKYIRLAAIVLFVVTILKLFLYDLAGSGTLTITVCFISLGVILLLVSFLYNKYKEVLFGEEKAEEGSRR